MRVLVVVALLLGISSVMLLMGRVRLMQNLHVERQGMSAAQWQDPLDDHADAVGAMGGLLALGSAVCGLISAAQWARRS